MTTIVSEKDLITQKDCDNRIKIMTDKIDKMRDRLVNFELKVTDKLAKMPKDLADEFDNRYAGKTTEKIVYSLIGIILTTFAVSMIYLVIRPSGDLEERLSNMEEIFNENLEIVE